MLKDSVLAYFLAKYEWNLYLWFPQPFFWFFSKEVYRKQWHLPQIMRFFSQSDLDFSVRAMLSTITWKSCYVGSSREMFSSMEIRENRYFLHLFRSYYTPLLWYQISKFLEKKSKLVQIHSNFGFFRNWIPASKITNVTKVDCQFDVYVFILLKFTTKTIYLGLKTVMFGLKKMILVQLIHLKLFFGQIQSNLNCKFDFKHDRQYVSNSEIRPSFLKKYCLYAGYCWIGLLDCSIRIAIWFSGLDCDWQSKVKIGFWIRIVDPVFQFQSNSKKCLFFYFLTIFH